MGEPFGFPRGTVRAALTGLLVLGAIVAAVIPYGDAAPKSTLVAIAGFAVRDYFHARSAQNKTDGPALDEPAEF